MSHIGIGELAIIAMIVGTNLLRLAVLGLVVYFAVRLALRAHSKSSP